MAMRIACATKRKDKSLSVYFAANEIMCLAELLKQKQDVQSIGMYGKASVTCLQLQKFDQGNDGTMLWTQRYSSKEIISEMLVEIGHFTRLTIKHLDCILEQSRPQPSLACLGHRPSRLVLFLLPVLFESLQHNWNW